MARYTFGDDEPAVRRMAMIHDAYEPHSRAFLETHAPMEPSLALDLGCGPGFSTRLISDSLRPRRLVGIDASPQFMQSARGRVADAEFETHDVTRTPLPHAPAGMIYARLLLAHLAEPLAIADAWRRQLVPGGVVLIEDLEDIEAPAGALRDYDEVSADIVRRGGGVMYAGPLLAALGGRCVRVTVSASTAATIYLFNVRLWLAGNTSDEVDDPELVELERALSRIEGADDRRPLSWIVRQIAIPADG